VEVEFCTVASDFEKVCFKKPVLPEKPLNKLSHNLAAGFSIKQGFL
jgi:hypothetical protein